MVKAVAKGRRNEKRAGDKLKELGYRVQRTYRTPYGDNDFFNIFDIIAISDDHILWVQVKSNRCPKKDKENIKAFKLPPNNKKQVWIWKDYKGWEIVDC